MAIQKSRPVAGTINDLDVLIIGGGVQGMWLLKELRQSHYKALLLEKGPLGGVQTCHSHVYIHQGYLYREDQDGLILRLKGVQEDWAKLRRRSFVQEGSLFGWRSPSEATTKERFWKTLGLECEEGKLPEAFAGSVVEKVFRSPEFCLNGEKLMNVLYEEVEEFVSEIRQVKRISIAGQFVEEVQVEMQRNQFLSFCPRVVVFAAGSGNEELLELLTPKFVRARTKNAQQIRKAHMLIVKSEKGVLPPFMGVFPDLRGLFIVSRELTDEGAVVWLISDYISVRLDNPDDDRTYNEQWWLPNVVLALQELAPRCFADQAVLQRLQWGIYQAPKAERRTDRYLPHEEHLEQFGMQNLWTIWPTKLTLAPKASRRLMQELAQPRNGRTLTPSPGWTASPVWQQLRRKPIIAKERWAETPLLSWADFCQQYNVG